MKKKIETLIYESVKKALNEMAMNRSDYIQRVLALLPQIAQNWCLCYYAKKSDIDQYKQLLEHWSTELKAQENLEGIKLKNGNKLRVTNYALIEAEDLDSNINNILNKIKYKFKAEHIENDIFIMDCAINFQNELTFLAQLISNDLELSASEYVDAFFFG